MNHFPKWAIILITVFVVICCIGAVFVIGGTAFLGIFATHSTSTNSVSPPGETTVIVTPNGSHTSVPEVLQPTDPALMREMQDTLKTLENSEVPINDPRALASQLKGIKNIPETLNVQPKVYVAGDVLPFWATNTDTNETFKVQSSLHFISPHLYIWIEDGVKFNQDDLNKLGTTFENKIYPTDREFFGSEWTPGIDNDIHLYVLYTRGLGGRIAGYFSSTDSLPPLAHPYSNAHEMFMVNADTTGLGDPFMYGVLAHEFQHMIHWFRDRNEDAWMNEGFSELAVFLNHYDLGGFDTSYVSNPDLQLNDWPNDPNATTPHYGAGFLFLDYFLNRFGENATKALVAEKANGFDSVDKVLLDLKIADPLTQAPIQANDVFADWTAAIYLNNKNVGDGRYTYANYPQAPKPGDTETVKNCPTNWQDRTVHQFGVDYIRIACRGAVTLNFKGSDSVKIVPVDAHSGRIMFWSNKGDESDMTLTHEFDFSQVSGAINLNYSTWYDLEKDYDFAYVEVSEDGGANWKILVTPSGTAANKSGNSYGWGYNGTSNGWLQESADLSPYAGKKVEVRFEYVTDAAVNGEGLLLDDISIPKINYSTDLEKDSGGWQGNGFVRIINDLPQNFLVSLIQEGGTTQVERVNLNANQTLSLPLTLNGDAILLVSGSTRFTRELANYSFEFVK